MRRTVLALGASLVVGLSALAWQAQPVQSKPPQDPAKPAQNPNKPAPDKKPEAPSEPQQDKVDFKDILDSWYKVTAADGTHIGYMHVVLRRATDRTGASRYVYDADAETEMMIPNPKDTTKQIPSVESVRIQAHLDDTYSPLDWQEAHHLDNADHNVIVTTDENGERKIEIVYSPTERDSFTLAPDVDVYFSRFLMLLSLRQGGHLARQGPRKLSVMQVQSKGLRPFVDVEVGVEPMMKREYLDKKSVSVTRVTYRKPPPARMKDLELVEAYVDRYGRPVEEVLKGGIKTLLVKNEEDAVGKGLLRQGARHDPFRKDLAMRYNPNAEEGGSGRGGPVTVDSVEAGLKDCRTQIEELKKAKEDGRDKEADDIYHRILGILEAIRKNLADKPNQELSRQADDVRKQIEDIWGGIERLMKKLKAINVSILEAFAKDDCDTMQKGLDELKKAQSAKELADTKELSELLTWIAKADPLIAKCKTRMELARKNIRLTGTVSYEDWTVQTVDGRVNVLGVQVGDTHGVRFIKPSRLAIINDKVYKVGDVVDGEGVRVERIGPNTIQVSLRDETREVGIRQ